MARNGKGLEVYSWECNCRHCETANKTSVQVPCDEASRVMKHSKEVSILLAACPRILTLSTGIVGPEFPCHTALLALKSVCMDVVLFGSFPFPVYNDYDLEVDQVGSVGAFVSWLYTGSIPSTCLVPPEVLWVLGANLQSPGFANEAMHFLFRKFRRSYITAETAEYVYRRTPDGSKLRKYVKDSICIQGPLSRNRIYGPGQSPENLKEMEDWRLLIRQRGALVVEIALEGSFTVNYTGQEKPPWHHENHHKYLEESYTRPIEDIIQRKLRPID